MKINKKYDVEYGVNSLHSTSESVELSFFEE